MTITRRQPISISNTPPENGNLNRVAPLPSGIPPDIHNGNPLHTTEVNTPGWLGTNGNLSHPPHPEHDDLWLMAFRLIRPLHRIYLDDFNSDHHMIRHSEHYPHRTCFCYERVIPGLIGAELRRSLDDPHKVGIGGTIRCRAIHLCPVCGLAAALNWQEDVIACEANLREQGYRLMLVVLTVYHEKSDSLQHIMDILKAGYDKLFNQRKKTSKRRSARLGIVGRLRSWDVLYSPEHGWHAHLNVMLAVKSDLTLETIRDELRVPYLSTVLKHHAFASIDHGLVVTEYKHGKSYTVKTGMEQLEIKRIGEKWTLGHEAVSAGGKRQSGLTIGQVRAIATGFIKDERLSREEARYLALEYGATMTGERMVITAGVVREEMKLVRRTKRDDAEDTNILTGPYEIEAVIESHEYWLHITQHNRCADLVENMRAGKGKLFDYLSEIGITIDARNISLQLAAYDSYNWAREEDTKRAIKTLSRELEHELILDEYENLEEYNELIE